MRVMVVGGAQSLIGGSGGNGDAEGNLGRRLAQNGVEVAWHTPYKKVEVVEAIPKGCEGVIIVKDLASHTLSESAFARARERGIPCARIQRKWSHAEPLLRMGGFLTAAPADRPLPRPGEVNEVARTYIIEGRESGRDPKHEEVLAALQRAFGLHVEFPFSQYQQVHAQAASIAPLAADLPGGGPSEDDMFAGAEALLDATPELLLERDRWLAETRDFLGCPVRIPESVFARAAHAFREQVDALGLTPEGRQTRDGKIAGWARRYRDIEVTAGRPMPSYRTFTGRSRDIFGVSIPRSIMLDLRADTLGDQSRDLLLTAPAYAYFQQVGGEHATETKAEFRALLDSGAIWGVQRGGEGHRMWFTSKPAIDDYWAQERPVREARAAQEAARSAVTLESLAALVAEQGERLARVEAQLAGLKGALDDPAALRKAVEAVLSGGVRLVLPGTSDSPR